MNERKYETSSPGTLAKYAEASPVPTRWKSEASLADIQRMITGNEGHLDAAHERADAVLSLIENIAARLFKYAAGAGGSDEMKKGLVASSGSQGFVNDIYSRLTSENKSLHDLFDKLVEIARALDTLEKELFE